MNQLMKTVSLIALLLCFGVAIAAASGGGDEKKPRVKDLALKDNRLRAEVTAQEPAAAIELGTPEAGDDPIGRVAQIIGDIRLGNWRMAAAGVLALLMMLLSRIRAKITLFRGDRGGAILVGILGLGGALAGALATDQALDWTLLVSALGVTWTAVGGYSWLKRLWKPSDVVNPSKPQTAPAEG